MSIKGGMVTIRDIADGVSGSGKVVKVPGAIIGCVYIKGPAPAEK